jgi:hypothetical protein
MNQVKRMKELKAENTRQRHAAFGLALDKMILAALLTSARGCLRIANALGWHNRWTKVHSKARVKTRPRSRSALFAKL